MVAATAAIVVAKLQQEEEEEEQEKRVRSTRKENKNKKSKNESNNSNNNDTDYDDSSTLCYTSVGVTRPVNQRSYVKRTEEEEIDEDNEIVYCTSRAQRSLFGAWLSLLYL